MSDTKEPTVVETTKPVVQETPAPAPQPTPTVVNTTQPTQPKPNKQPTDDFDIRVENVLKSNNKNVIFVYNNLKTYVDNMGKGTNLDDSTGARQQYMLWSTIRNVANNYTPKDFKESWNLILAFYKKHSGQGDAFNPKKINRFAHSWNYPVEELTALQSINDLLMLTMDHTKRASNLKLISFEKTLQYGFTEEGRQRIISYYTA